MKIINRELKNLNTETAYSITTNQQPGIPPNNGKTLIYDPTDAKERSFHGPKLGSSKERQLHQGSNTLIKKKICGSLAFV